MALRRTTRDTDAVIRGLARLALLRFLPRRLLPPHVTAPDRLTGRLYQYESHERQRDRRADDAGSQNDRIDARHGSSFGKAGTAPAGRVN